MNNTEHKVVISYLLWFRLIRRLRISGKGKRESGAFLLGKCGESCDRVTTFISYDKLDESAYDSGIVVLQSHAFSKLWSVCRERKLRILADVHTHPRGAYQSPSDQTNPMISEQGHVALIVPNFAQGSFLQNKGLGVYQYLGNYEWRNWSNANRKDKFQIKLW